MKHPLKTIGEFGLIEKIRQWFDEKPGDDSSDSPGFGAEPYSPGSESLIGSESPGIGSESRGIGSEPLGIGDDCAVIPRDANHVELVTTDLLIEETHFLMDKILPEQLGHKSLAVNLSDIAAMGGTPRHAWLSIGLTEQTDLEWLERFFKAMQELAHRHGVKLLGGDTTRSRRHLVINILVTGTAAPEQVKYRSDARTGDIVFVTGMLGDSGGGLQLLLNDHHLTDDPAERHLIHAHNHPEAAVEGGRWLGTQSAVHALIDVSDGIASDAGHIAGRSGVTIDIELEQLPISKELQQTAKKYGWDPVNMACSAGEDYVLLGTCDPESWSSLNRSYRDKTGNELYAVGHVHETAANGKKRSSTTEPSVSGPESDVASEMNGPGRPKDHGRLRAGNVRFLKDGKPVDRTNRGFDHFKSTGL